MINSLILGFAMGWIGSMPLAGASSIFVFHRGLGGQFRRGLALAAGAAVAEGSWCLIAVFGTARLLSSWPHLTEVARSIGGLILLGLGAYFLMSRKTLPVPDDNPDTDLETTWVFLGEFWLGFGLVAGNISIPLTWFGMITVVVSLGLDPLAGPPWAFALAVAAGIMGWFSLLLKILATFRENFHRRTQKRLMKAMGILLLAAGLGTLLYTWL
jgi:threonine/homoserine/homoserine lactone efflux protein